MRCILLLLPVAATAACYAPSYRDCEVSCASGLCPSGLTCDPQLLLCRVAGAGPTCDHGGGDDAAMDTRDAIFADTGADGPPAAFCAGHMTDLFCADFDESSLPTNGWSAAVESAGASLTLVTPGKSAPHGLEAATNSSDGSSAIEAYATQSLTVPPSFATIKVAFDVRFDVRDNAQLPKGAVELRLGSYNVAFVSNGATQTYFIVNGNAASQVFDNGYVLTTWYHIEITATHSGNEVTTTATRDGVPVSTTGQIGGPVQAPLATSASTLQMGAMNQSQNGACIFDYDNVVITKT